LQAIESSTSAISISVDAPPAFNAASSSGLVAADRLVSLRRRVAAALGESDATATATATTNAGMGSPSSRQLTSPSAQAGSRGQGNSAAQSLASAATAGCVLIATASDLFGGANPRLLAQLEGSFRERALEHHKREVRRTKQVLLQLHALQQRLHRDAAISGTGAAGMGGGKTLLSQASLGLAAVRMRAFLKLGWHQEARRQTEKAVKAYALAYDALAALPLNTVSTALLLPEAKAAAEYLCFRMASLYLRQRDVIAATPNGVGGLTGAQAAPILLQWHLRHWERLVGADPALFFLHWRWLAKQYMVFGDLLVRYCGNGTASSAAAAAAAPRPQLSPSYYYHTAALFAIKHRKAAAESGLSASRFEVKAPAWLRHHSQHTAVSATSQPTGGAGAAAANGAAQPPSRLLSAMAGVGCTVFPAPPVLSSSGKPVPAVGDRRFFACPLAVAPRAGGATPEAPLPSPAVEAASRIAAEFMAKPSAYFGGFPRICPAALVVPTQTEVKPAISRNNSARSMPAFVPTAALTAAVPAPRPGSVALIDPLGVFGAPDPLSDPLTAPAAAAAAVAVVATQEPAASRLETMDAALAVEEDDHAHSVDICELLSVGCSAAAAASSGATPGSPASAAVAAVGPDDPTGARLRRSSSAGEIEAPMPTTGFYEGFSAHVDRSLALIRLAEASFDHAAAVLRLLERAQLLASSDAGAGVGTRLAIACLQAHYLFLKESPAVKKGAPVPAPPPFTYVKGSPFCYILGPGASRSRVWRHWLAADELWASGRVEACAKLLAPLPAYCRREGWLGLLNRCLARLRECAMVLDDVQLFVECSFEMVNPRLFSSVTLVGDVSRDLTFFLDAWNRTSGATGDSELTAPNSGLSVTFPRIAALLPSLGLSGKHSFRSLLSSAGESPAPADTADKNSLQLSSGTLSVEALRLVDTASLVASVSFASLPTGTPGPAHAACHMQRGDTVRVRVLLASHLKFPITPAEVEVQFVVSPGDVPFLHPYLTGASGSTSQSATTAAPTTPSLQRGVQRLRRTPKAENGRSGDASSLPEDAARFSVLILHRSSDAASLPESAASHSSTGRGEVRIRHLGAIALPSKQHKSSIILGPLECDLQIAAEQGWGMEFDIQLPCSRLFPLLSPPGCAAADFSSEIPETSSFHDARSFLLQATGPAFSPIAIALSGKARADGVGRIRDIRSGELVPVDRKCTDPASMLSLITPASAFLDLTSAVFDREQGFVYLASETADAASRLANAVVSGERSVSSTLRSAAIETIACADVVIRGASIHHMSGKTSSTSAHGLSLSLPPIQATRLPSPDAEETRPAQAAQVEGFFSEATAAADFTANQAPLAAALTALTAPSIAQACAAAYISQSTNSVAQSLFAPVDPAMQVSALLRHAPAPAIHLARVDSLDAVASDTKSQHPYAHSRSKHPVTTTACQQLFPHLTVGPAASDIAYLSVHPSRTGTTALAAQSASGQKEVDDAQPALRMMDSYMGVFDVTATGDIADFSLTSGVLNELTISIGLRTVLKTPGIILSTSLLEGNGGDNSSVPPETAHRPFFVVAPSTILLLNSGSIVSARVYATSQPADATGGKDARFISLGTDVVGVVAMSDDAHLAAGASSDLPGPRSLTKHAQTIQTSIGLYIPSAVASKRYRLVARAATLSDLREPTSACFGNFTTSVLAIDAHTAFSPRATGVVVKRSVASAPLLNLTCLPMLDALSRPERSVVANVKMGEPGSLSVRAGVEFSATITLVHPTTVPLRIVGVEYLPPDMDNCQVQTSKKSVESMVLGTSAQQSRFVGNKTEASFVLTARTSAPGVFSMGRLLVRWRQDVSGIDSNDAGESGALFSVQESTIEMPTLVAVSQVLTCDLAAKREMLVSLQNNSDFPFALALSTPATAVSEGIGASVRITIGPRSRKTAAFPSEIASSSVTIVAIAVRDPNNADAVNDPNALLLSPPILSA
jgi:hypothetical protein